MQLEGEDDVSAERSTGSTVLQTCFNLVRALQSSRRFISQSLASLGT